MREIQDSDEEPDVDFDSPARPPNAKTTSRRPSEPATGTGSTGDLKSSYKHLISMLISEDSLKRNIEAAHRELIESGSTESGQGASLHRPNNDTSNDTNNAKSSPIPSSLFSQKSPRTKTSPSPLVGSSDQTDQFMRRSLSEHVFDVSQGGNRVAMPGKRDRSCFHLFEQHHFSNNLFCFCTKNL